MLRLQYDLVVLLDECMSPPPQGTSSFRWLFRLG
jgi:hypothetical protein